MTAPAMPRYRPPLPDLEETEGLTRYQHERVIAAMVVEGELDLNQESARDLIANLLATIEEHQRVNVGLLNENTDLKRRLAPGGDAAENLVPGLEKAYELIANAIAKS